MHGKWAQMHVTDNDHDSEMNKEGALRREEQQPAEVGGRLVE